MLGIYQFAMHRIAAVDVETCGILLAALADVRFVRPCGAAFVCARTEGVDA
jgi:hypothetical protein